jgi:hypothetical protein
VIEEKRKEQEAIRHQYTEELQRYRELKKQQPAKSAPTSANKL